MIVVWLLLLGLVMGSFVNAFAWRLHKNKPELSIWKGRSVCVHCRHQLAAKDLMPVLSWLSLRGRCRYCRQPIDWQYPLVEVATASLFVVSYLWWPMALQGSGLVSFGVWLAVLTGFVALAVYDLRWMILPHKIVYPLIGLALGNWLLIWLVDGLTAIQLRNIGLSVLIAGGLFYGLFQVSRGKWIGGGDVKLGFLLGLLVADPLRAWLLLFLASLLGSLVTIPLLVSGKATRGSRIPFGPFLLAAGFVMVVFGPSLTAWFERAILFY